MSGRREFKIRQPNRGNSYGFLSAHLSVETRHLQTSNHYGTLVLRPMPALTVERLISHKM